MADPNAILAVVCVDRITNESNANMKTRKQIELTVVFNSLEVDVINGGTGIRKPDERSEPAGRDTRD